MTEAHVQFELEIKLARAVERNAVLIVALRHLAQEVHRHGQTPGHQAVSDWTRCVHQTCRYIHDAIEGQKH